MFSDGQDERLRLNVKLDDLERRLRKKIDEFKKLEAEKMSSEVENDVVKR